MTTCNKRANDLAQERKRKREENFISDYALLVSITSTLTLVLQLMPQVIWGPHCRSLDPSSCSNTTTDQRLRQRLTP
ncbi:hypothetical protein BaRGS_00016814 [Batillaria attramentaria]|uniref:Uncharacterized protein n=1 Tax=Batillaria attramentaria TaxID=370345 RepID=A0ABD0KXU8_9CAEN